MVKAQQVFGNDGFQPVKERSGAYLRANPLNKNRDPDISYITMTVNRCAALATGTLVVLESRRIAGRRTRTCASAGSRLRD